MVTINKIDFNFNYKHSLRNILINKLNILTNTYNIPKIQKLTIFFFLKKIEDFNDVQIYNYFYLFKFFFGCNAFISKYKTFFALGIWTYSFNIQLIFNNKYIYNNLYYFINDFFPFMFLDFIKWSSFKQEKKIIYLCQFKDMNIFNEKKTNLGLFYLKQSLQFKLEINGKDKKETDIIMNNFKIRLIS